MSTLSQSARTLAIAVSAGPMDSIAGMLSRVEPLLYYKTKKARWVHPVVEDLGLRFGAGPRPTRRKVADYLMNHEGFLKAWGSGKASFFEEATESLMAPAPGAPSSWQIPTITTLGGLAAFLRLHLDDLGWLTSFGQADHYLHRWRAKPKSGRFRLLEIPKPLLKLAQRGILRRILDAVPPHESATGFRPGRSVREFVEPHVKRPLLLRMDLQDFFPSITASRILRLFLTAGYPEVIADALTRLCTHAAPATTLSERPLTQAERKRLSTPHLPQGAPTSPALANLCAFRLDCRLAGLARSAGADYTRYADDLLFSGDAKFARQAHRFSPAVAAILLEEGLLPNHRKTRLLRSGQRQCAAGLVLNHQPSVSRSDFDRLKAILTNCLRSGPDGQNRMNHPDFRAHLAGKISWHAAFHDNRGKKLRALFDQIQWNAMS